MKQASIQWELLWKGLAAGDRNGGPVRLATLLHQNVQKQDGFCTEKIFQTYSDWFFRDGFDTGPTMMNVMFLVKEGRSIEDAVLPEFV